MYVKLHNLIISCLLSLFCVVSHAQIPDHPMSANKVLNIQQWQTKQAVPVYFVYSPVAPMLDIQLTFNAGSARDGENLGLASLTNNLLSEQALTVGLGENTNRFAKVGALFSNHLDRDMAWFKLRSLTDPHYLNSALQTFIQVLTKPDFSADRFARVKTQQQTLLQNVLRVPALISKKVFYETAFKNHPYGHLIEGDQAFLNKVTPTMVRNFYQQYYVAHNAMIAIVGDISVEQAHQIAEQMTQALILGKPAPSLPPAQSALPMERTIRFPSQQTAMIQGQVSITPGDPDYFPLLLGNDILGGSDKIAKLTGYATSKLVPLQANGAFIISSQTSREKVEQTGKMLQKTLIQFVQQGPSATEMVTAKKNITNNFLYQLDSNNKILTYLVYIGFYHLPLDYLDTYRDKVNAVTEQQIITAFRHHLDPNHLIKVVTGPKP